MRYLALLESTHWRRPFSICRRFCPLLELLRSANNASSRQSSRRRSRVRAGLNPDAQPERQRFVVSLPFVAIRCAGVCVCEYNNEFTFQPVVRNRNPAATRSCSNASLPSSSWAAHVPREQLVSATGKDVIGLERRAIPNLPLHADRRLPAMCDLQI